MAEIFVGDNNAAVPVLMDTATDLFAIDSDYCFESCAGVKALESGDVEQGTDSEPIVTQVSYGERSLIGEQVEGKVCLDQ